MTQPNYILAVGHNGKERLQILDDVFKKTSYDLLLNGGIAAGKQVLEIGCGTGNMTRWLAKQVGRCGQLDAIDISKEQLDIAISQARQAGLDNINFIESSLHDFEPTNQYDIIYSRLVLMHVPQPYSAIKKLKKFLKPQGRLIFEEACNSISCFPPSKAYRKSRQLLLKLAKQQKLDFNLGEKLYSYFRSLKLKIDFINYVQPIYNSEREKLLVPLFFSETKDNYLRYKLANEAEINLIHKELCEFVKNENNLISFPRVMQIVGINTREN